MQIRNIFYVLVKVRAYRTLTKANRRFVAIASVGLFMSSNVFAEDAVFESNKESLQRLSGFIIQLEKTHPQLQQTKLSITAAEARSRAAEQPLYNPELALDAERVGLHGNKSDAVTLGINQTIDWHDKRAARTNVANSLQRVSRFQQSIHREQLIADILLALTDFQTQKTQTAAHENRLNLMEKVMLQAELLYGAGDISKLELEQLRLSQSQAQLVRDQATTQLNLQHMQLSSVAGVEQTNWPELPSHLPDFTHLDYKHLLKQHPVYRAHLASVEAADNSLRLRRVEKKADPTLGFRVGDEDSDTIIGLSLSIPLNFRNTYQAEVDEASAEYQRSQYMVESEAHLLQTRLKAAVKNYQLTYSSWQAWHQATGSSLQKQSKLLLKLWKAGELSTSDYLLQLDQIKDVEMNNVELTGNVWKSWFNWLAASHQFDAWLSGNYSTGMTTHSGTGSGTDFVYDNKREKQ